jgi:pSer/pThr/pTyr-binding forkhead associated (FHA) protein
MAWKCPVCGTENQDEEFCSGCGVRRDTEMQTAQQAESQPQVESQPQMERGEAQAEPQQVQQPLQEIQQEPQQPQQVPQQPQPQTQMVQGKYYVQFIATPVSSLNKTKLPLDFEVFENISVGRSPENVLVIPDVEVSRRHAILYREGDSLYLEDQNSTNGTYLYDGKVFQQVKGKVQLPPNALVKLGSSTIVKIVRE